MTRRSRRDARILTGYRLVAAAVAALVLVYALRPF
jgi:hypothetical protein